MTPKWSWLPVLASLALLACSRQAEDRGVRPTEDPGCTMGLFQAGEALYRGDHDQVPGLLAGQRCERARFLSGMDHILTGKGPAVMEALYRDRSADAKLRAMAATFISVTNAAEDPGGATTWAKRALEIEPREPAALLVLALLTEANEWVEALATPCPAFEDPRDMVLRDLGRWVVSVFTLGRGSLPEGTGKDARVTVARLMVELADDRSGKAYAQYLRMARRELELALGDLHDAAQEDARLLADVCWRLQDFPGMAKVAAAYLQAHPHDPEMTFMEMAAYHRLGDYERVLAFEGKPEVATCESCTLILAESMFKLGKREVIPLLRGFVVQFPANSDGWSLLGRARVLFGELERGISNLQRALNENPGDMAAAQALANALARGGRQDEAEKVRGIYQALFQSFERDARRGEAHENAAASYQEARALLCDARPDVTRAEELVVFIVQREPDHPLLPLLELSVDLALGRSVTPQSAARFLAMAAQANPWLSRGGGGR